MLREGNPSKIWRLRLKSWKSLSRRLNFNSRTMKRKRNNRVGIAKSLSMIVMSILLGVFLFSCKHEIKPKQIKIEKADVETIIEETNRKNIAIEDRQIDDFLARRNWSFKKTASGLRYTIYRRGQGVQPQSGQVASLEYTLSLIRGDEVYNSVNDGPMIFTVDREEQTAGIHEFVKLMHVGDKAKLIVPSYLGYGVTGDEKKIPPRATLIYDLSLMRVQ